MFRAAFLKTSFFLATVLFFLNLTVSSIDAAPPAGFQRSLLVGSGLDGPSGFEVSPDGRIFILERTGKVKVFRNGQLLPQPFIDLPSIASGDRGLIGIAFDPDFNSNQYVYFYYTALDKLNYLVRLDASGDVATEPPHILYQTYSPSELLHVGGSIDFGNDGKLYFAVGDNGYPPNSQMLDNPHGKIMRINKDGSVPTDNPFVGVPNALPEIWAYGFRNPWRFQIDSVSGRIYGGDVGDYTWEEVNKIDRGKNYGWPRAEGFCTGCPYENPVYAYNHDGQSSAVTGGPIYRGDMFPEQYRGNLFFADYARGFIRRATLNTAGGVSAVYDFDTAAGSVVDLKQAADGSLYYITYYPGHLYRVHYSEGNSIPVVFAGADKRGGTEPLTVQFSSAGTFDPDGDVLSFVWNFGDGSSSNEPNPTHVYTARGKYEITLTVTDINGDSSQAIPLLVQVGIPPEVTVSIPTEGYLYQAGDDITVNSHAIDGFGNDISDAEIRTDVIFHHDTHTHPFIEGLIGRAHTFAIPDRGEAAANTWYRIRVTATDPGGLSQTKEVNIYPRTSTVTLKTFPEGLSLNLDGKPVQDGHQFLGVERFVRELSVAPEQSVNGKSYVFVGWSDGQNMSHTILTPDADTTYTANYIEVPAYNAAYFNNTQLTGSSVLTRNENLIDNDWFEGSPGFGVQADQFSARWSRTHSFVAGTYTFYLATDDGVRVKIDDTTVIDRWFDQGAPVVEIPVYITNGEHTVTVEYYEMFGGASARVVYALTTADSVNPSPTPTASPTPSPTPILDPHMGYVGEFYNNETLTGTPVFNKMYSEIGFNWGDGSPDDTVNDNVFSARFARHYHDLAPGIYEFRVLADDGVRVKLNNETIIDQWILQPATEYIVQKEITDVHNDIVIEYFEQYGGAVLEFSFRKIGGGVTTGEFTTRYWNIPGSVDVPYVIPTREADFITTDNVIDFAWAGLSPNSVIQTDKFLGQWIGQFEFEEGEYRFRTSADDGVRVYLDNQLIINAWVLQPATEYEVVVPVSAGLHTIRVEYFEHYGEAVMSFEYQKVVAPEPTPTIAPTAEPTVVPTPEPTTAPTSTPSPTTPPQDAWNGEYWNMGADKDIPYQIPITTPSLVRFDTAIDFDWENGSPDSLINLDKYVARWTREVVLESGTYEFVTTSDDGVRVFVNDHPVIDKWQLMGGDVYKGTIVLGTGTHSIRVEYFEHYGGAQMKMNYGKIQN